MHVLIDLYANQTQTSASIRCFLSAGYVDRLRVYIMDNASPTQLYTITRWSQFICACLTFNVPVLSRRKYMVVISMPWLSSGGAIGATRPPRSQQIFNKRLSDKTIRHCTETTDRSSTIEIIILLFQFDRR
jgi:hypothetical protein